MQTIDERNLPPGTIFRTLKNNYHIWEKIGEGQFSTVYFCTNVLTNEEVALQFVPASFFQDMELIHVEKLTSLFDKEITILEKLKSQRENLEKQYAEAQKDDVLEKIADHDVIVRYIEGVQSEQGWIIVMQFLRDFIQLTDVELEDLQKEERVEMIRQILMGVRCLESSGIIHRDLDDESKKIQIIDFGLSKNITDGLDGAVTTSRVGTTYCQPPLICSSQTCTPYNVKNYDIWSVGVVFYEIIYLKSVYSLLRNPTEIENEQNQSIDYDSEEELQQLIDDMVEEKLVISYPNFEGVTENDVQLLKNCLQIDEMKRMNSVQLLDLKLFKK